MKIVEAKVSNNDWIFDLNEFLLSRPLFAHSGRDQSAERSLRSPRSLVSLGRLPAVDSAGGYRSLRTWKRDRGRRRHRRLGPAHGLCQHVGFRGVAEVLPFDVEVAKTIFRRYFGPDEAAWDARFADVLSGEAGLELVCFTLRRAYRSSATNPIGRHRLRPRTRQG